MVCNGGPLLLRAWMQQVALLRHDHGIEVIWVTSGAIASAASRVTAARKQNRTLSEKQALSAIGQPMVMDLYLLALAASGLLGAQILLTYDDIADLQRRTNFQNTLEQLLAWGVTPVLNENDAVATEEIKFGDNDSLSARVAVATNADRLVILTDVAGLYDSDPHRNSSARRVPRLSHISAELIESTDRGSESSRGTGGMYSKLSAAKLATDQGIETWLVQGDEPSVLLKITSNTDIGTRIDAARTCTADSTADIVSHTANGTRAPGRVVW